MKSEISSIQYLRSLAVLMVVWVHAKEQFHWLDTLFTSNLGVAGVDLFFVISGFIMVYTTHNRNITPARFFWRRILRIVPLYWFYTLLLVSIALLLPNVVRSVAIDWQHITFSMLFIPQISPVFPNFYWPTLIPGWTLNYEMAFYFIFALALFLPEKYRILALGTTLLSLIVYGNAADSENSFDFYSELIILEFLLGSMLAKWYVAGRIHKNNTYGYITILISIIFFIIAHEIQLGDRFYSSGIPALGVLYGALKLEYKENIFGRFIHEIGNASYSIYLSHIFTLGLLRAVWNKFLFTPSDNILLFGIAFMIIAISASTFAGWISYKLIEEKINNKLRKKSH